MSEPSKRTAPSKPSTRPEMQLKTVVLPAPLGPIRPVIVPASTEKVAPSRARTPPKLALISLTSSNAPVVGIGSPRYDVLPDGWKGPAHHRAAPVGFFPASFL